MTTNNKNQMPMKQITPEIKKKLIEFQRNEITEYHIYRRLAKRTKSAENAKVLERIAREELNHYNIFKKYSGTEVKPNRLSVWFYVFMSLIFGLTFTVKLMEQGEESAQERYEQIKDYIPEAESVIKDEYEHEHDLIKLINEEMLDYMGSIVLGLNDALVELTGALAGFTLALQNTELIAIIGAITGFAAALSMAASEYLSTKAEDTGKNAFKASFYTGLAYILTVILLILPYTFLENYYFALALALIFAILIIAFFNYFIAVVKDLNFRQQFFEMVFISLSVSAISFFIGLLVRKFFNIEI